MMAARPAGTERTPAAPLNAAGAVPVGDPVPAAVPAAEVIEAVPLITG